MTKSDDETFVDPIDVHLAAGNGAPFLVDEARHRVVDPDVNEDDDDDEFDDDVDEIEADCAELDARQERRIEADNAPHVVVHAMGAAAGGKCLHCSAELSIILPVKLTDWCAATRAFADQHAKCKPKQKHKS